MGLGRYVTNFGVISALLSGLGTRKQTQNMPEDKRRYLVWISWGISLLTAILAVRNSESDKEFIAQRKKAKKKQKKQK